VFFYSIAPNMVAAMTQAEEERKMWELVEERGITYLMTTPRCFDRLLYDSSNGC
jgi:acyl-coenzyme A synthetase/AMP-(fatty) acid ligase